MKRIIAIMSTLILALTAGAQDNYHFFNPDGKVIWQKIFTSQMDTTELVDALVASGRFENIYEKHGTITCRLIDRKLDYEGAGYSRMDTPMLFLGSTVSFFATIQVKNGKYRVTIEEVMFSVNSTLTVFNDREVEPLEFYALKHGDFRRDFWESMADIMERCFSSLFTFEQKDYLGGGW